MKDTLIQRNDISMATLQDVSETAEAEIITDFDDFAENSLIVQKRNKDALASMKQKVMLTLDRKKLSQAEKIFRGMENVQEIFSDDEIMGRVRDSTKTALDIKLLAEAYAKMLDSQQKLMRLDSVDEKGNATRLSLDVQLGKSNITGVKTVIYTEG